MARRRSSVGEIPPEDENYKYFVQAIDANDRHALTQLIEKGVSVNCSGGWQSQTPLHLAAESGKAEMYELLVSLGADEEATDKYGLTPSAVVLRKTPLPQAVASGNVAIVRLLLTLKADVYSRNESSQTPLHAAAERGVPTIIQLLVEHEAELEAKDKTGWTPLHVAAWHGQLDASTTLVQLGGKLSSIDMNGGTPLHAAAWNGSVKLANHLVELRANIESKDKNGVTPLNLILRHTSLQKAARSGDPQPVRLLLRLRAEVTANAETGQTPLLVAAEKGFTEVAAVLLEHGVDMEAKDTAGDAALHVAGKLGHMELLKLLVEQKADLESLNAAGQSLLHWALDNSKSDVARLLVESNASLGPIDAGGRMLLHWAVINGKKEAATLLMALGASSEVADAEGKSPLDLVPDRGDARLEWTVVLLPGFSAAKLQAMVKEKKTPEGTWLHSAAARGNVLACKALVEAGALPNLENSKGKKPIDLASELGLQDVVDYLGGFDASSSGAGAERIGSGEAFEQAMADEEPVTKVEWVSYVMPGHSLVQHSILKITVAGTEGPKYILEKCDHDRSGEEKFRNGVVISSWEEVRVKLTQAKERHQLLQEQMKSSVFTMRLLREEAVKSGPYDVGSSNCHQTARAVYNYCAQSSYRVSRLQMPNRLLTGFAALTSGFMDWRGSRLSISAGTS